jgi:hypothetical protein
MNIFFFNKDPKICAQQHCDKHCIKMIIEYAQLLSTAHRVLDGVLEIRDQKNRKQKYFKLIDVDMESNLYKATHINHPSAKWVRQSDSNYMWLYTLWINLLDEYSKRYNKIHSCSRLIPYLKNVPFSIPKNLFTSPFRAMPIEYKLDKSEIDYCEKSYQLYFNSTKQHIAKWKHGLIPSWYQKIEI